MSKLELGHICFYLMDIVYAGSRRYVSSVHETVNVEVGNALGLSHGDGCLDVIYVAVNASV